MIEINLLPGARRAKSSARQPIEFKALAGGMSTAFRDRYLVITVALTVVAVVVGAALFLYQTTRTTTLADRQEKSVADSVRYANFLKERSRSEAVRDTLLRQVNIIRGLDEDRYVWPHVMDEISRALPQYTWLTSVAMFGTPQGTNNVVAAPAKPVEDSAAAKRHKAKRLDTDIPQDTIKVQDSRDAMADIQRPSRFTQSDLRGVAVLLRRPDRQGRNRDGPGQGSHPVPAHGGLHPPRYTPLASRAVIAVGGCDPGREITWLFYRRIRAIRSSS